MSLMKIKLSEVVKKQFFFKWKSYIGIFTTLIVLQILAILFSFNGVGMMGSGMPGLNVSINFYSADIVIGFTLFWGFITAILLTTKAYRNDDFTFVTNRLSSHLSNGLFMITMSLYGALTGMLASFLIKVIIYIYLGGAIQGALTVPAFEFLVGLVTTFFYVLGLSVLGYFVGMLVQLHSSLRVILPVAFFGLLFINPNNEPILQDVFQYYFAESSFFVFSVKMITTVTVLFVSTILLTNKVEVNR